MMSLRKLILIFYCRFSSIPRLTPCTLTNSLITFSSRSRSMHKATFNMSTCSNSSSKAFNSLNINNLPNSSLNISSNSRCWSNSLVSLLLNMPNHSRFTHSRPLNSRVTHSLLTTKSCSSSHIPNSSQSWSVNHNSPSILSSSSNSSKSSITDRRTQQGHPDIHQSDTPLPLSSLSLASLGMQLPVVDLNSKAGRAEVSPSSPAQCPCTVSLDSKSGLSS